MIRFLIVILVLLASARAVTAYNSMPADGAPLKEGLSYRQRKAVSLACAVTSPPRHTRRKPKQDTVPELSISLQSIRRYSKPNVEEFDGWKVQIAYKFNRSPDKTKSYEFWYSARKGSVSDQASIPGYMLPTVEKPYTREDLLQKAIFLSSTGGTLNVFLSGNGQQELKPGMKKLLFVRKINKQEMEQRWREDYWVPEGDDCSNYLALPLLPGRRTSNSH